MCICISLTQLQQSCKYRYNCVEYHCHSVQDKDDANSALDMLVAPLMPEAVRNTKSGAT